MIPARVVVRVRVRVWLTETEYGHHFIGVPNFDHFRYQFLYTTNSHWFIPYHFKTARAIVVGKVWENTPINIESRRGN